MGLVRHAVRHAVRHHARARGFSAAALATLALAIGATTAIFSLVHATLLRPLPYAEPDALIMVWRPGAAGETTRLSASEVRSYAAEARSFDAFGVWMTTASNLTGGGEPERVASAAVTPGLFRVLGVAPLLGRPVEDDDAVVGRERVVVLGHGLWQRRFGGDPAIVGRDIELNDAAHRVIGVMPPSFRLPLDFGADRSSEAWTPLALEAPELAGWGNRSLVAVARLAAGATPASATRELGAVATGWIRAGHVVDQGDGALFRSAVPLGAFVAGRARDVLIALLVAVGLMLLVAAANVGGLFLAEASARRRELAVRGALGAERRHVVAELLTESVGLALLGGVLGLAVAGAALGGFASAGVVPLPRGDEAGLDGLVLAFALAVAIASGAFFGLLPALAVTRADHAALLQDGGRTSTAGRGARRLRGALVIGQIAASMVLAVGAGLVTRSLLAMSAIDLGFQPSGVLTAQVQLPPARYPEPGDVVRFYRRVTEALATTPGVASAGAVRVLPLAADIGDWSITIEGRPYDPVENPNADFQAATPGYFSAMGLPLLRGRLFTDRDDEMSPLVAVINDVMAARYWPGVEALGRRFHMGTAEQPWVTVVGVVGTIRHNAIVEEPRAEMYLPHAQLPREIGGTPRSMTLVVRTAGAPLALVGMARDAVHSLDPSLPLANIRTMEDVTLRALAGPRTAAWLLVAFAALALVVSGLGVYAAVALLVAEQRTEIGIRMALGASRGSVVTGVLRHGLAVMAAGLALGTAAAVAGSTVVGSLLHGVAPRDPASFTLAAATLAAAGLLAALVPALAAARIDPTAALRG
ncbi:MAG: ABC transporter permease [Acidobacteriota bacterium]